MHPISYDLDYALERNRLTTFFRLIVAIPWIVVGYIYAIVALVVWIISWLALLFTARYPGGLYRFISGYLRFNSRLQAFVLLGTDQWPKFSGGEHPEYPVRLAIAPPQAEYSRLKTFFKGVTAFPQFLLGYGVNLLVGAAAFISWWRIMFTGKQSATMHDAMRAGMAYQTRSTSFLFLLTEVHPRLLDLPAQAYPADAPGLPPAPAATSIPPAAPEPGA